MASCVCATESAVSSTHLAATTCLSASPTPWATFVRVQKTVLKEAVDGRTGELHTSKACLVSKGRVMGPLHDVR